jgi:hypothetical protein
LAVPALVIGGTWVLRPIVRKFFTLRRHGGERGEIGMRRAVATSVAVMMMIGGGASYALFGRLAPHKVELSTSAADAPRLETARMFTQPIVPPEPDLIAAKLAPPPTVWPDAPKPVVKAKRAEAAKTDAAKPPAVKIAGAKPAKPKPKKQAANATAVQ